MDDYEGSLTVMMRPDQPLKPRQWLANSWHLLLARARACCRRPFCSVQTQTCPGKKNPG